MYQSLSISNTVNIFHRKALESTMEKLLLKFYLIQDIKNVSVLFDIFVHPYNHNRDP